MKILPLTFPFDRRSRWKSMFMAICLGLFSSVAFAQDTEATSTPVDFVRDIQPILRANCYECHAGTTEEGGLNLGIKARAIKGGDSDAAIVSGKSKESLLIQLVSGNDEDRLMPPEGNMRLMAKQISRLRAWIDQGTQWPDDADVVDPKSDRAKSHCGHFNDSNRRKHVHNSPMTIGRRGPSTNLSDSDWATLGSDHRNLPMHEHWCDDCILI